MKWRMPKRSTLVITGVVLLLLVAWRVLGALDIVTAERLKALIQNSMNIQESIWLTPVIILVYTVILLLMFPLTVLVIATGMIFGAWWGLFFAVMGTLTSSALTFWIGKWLGQDRLSRVGGKRVTKAADYFSERGVRTMIVINLLPIAPFTLTNLMAGAFGLGFGRYMIGSTIGIVPGLVAVTVLGSQLGAVLLTGDTADWMTPLLIGLACVGMLAALPYLARRLKGH